MVLMLCLLITANLGVLLRGAEKNAGPLVHWFVAADALWADTQEELHEFFVSFSLQLIVIHIKGVITESLLHRKNLLLAIKYVYKTHPPVIRPITTVTGNQN